MSGHLYSSAKLAAAPRVALNTAGEQPFVAVDLSEDGYSYLTFKTPEEGRALIAAITNGVALLEATERPLPMPVCPECGQHYGHLLLCSLKPPCPQEWLAVRQEVTIGSQPDVIVNPRTHRLERLPAVTA